MWCRHQQRHTFFLFTTQKSQNKLQSHPSPWAAIQCGMLSSAQHFFHFSLHCIERVFSSYWFWFPWCFGMFWLQPVGICEKLFTYHIRVKVKKAAGTRQLWWGQEAGFCRRFWQSKQQCVAKGSRVMRVTWKPSGCCNLRRIKTDQELKWTNFKKKSSAVRQSMCQLNSGSFCQADRMLDFSVTQSNGTINIHHRFFWYASCIVTSPYILIWCDILYVPSSWIVLDTLNHRRLDGQLRTTNYQVDADAATWCRHDMRYQEIIPRSWKQISGTWWACDF